MWTFFRPVINLHLLKKIKEIKTNNKHIKFILKIFLNIIKIFEMKTFLLDSSKYEKINKNKK